MALASMQQQMQRCIACTDGHALARLLDQIDSHSLGPISHSLAQTVAGPYIKAYAVHASDPVDFPKALASYSVLTQTYTVQWMEPVLRRATSRIVAHALAVDATNMRTGSKPVCSVELQAVLARFVSVLLSERTSPKTKLSLLIPINATFKLYFTINEMHMCTAVMGQIEKEALRKLDFDAFCAADRVLFYYYAGRFKLYFHAFKQADFYLSLAFECCLKSNWQMKRQILIFQVSARIPRGALPTHQILSKYNISTYFLPLVCAFKSGDYKAFCSALNMHREWFVERGLYMLLKERVKVCMYRNLFRTCFDSYRESNPTSFAMPIAYVLPAIRLSGIIDPEDTIDVACAECVFVSLIDQGYIRGYIEHFSSCIVFSKSGRAFPLLRDVVQPADPF